MTLSRQKYYMWMVLIAAATLLISIIRLLAGL
jgi:hypothetical protein